MGVRIDRADGQPATLENGVPRVYDAKRDAPTHRFIRADQTNPEKDKPLQPGVPSVLGNGKLAIKPVERSMQAYYPDSRHAVQNDLVAQKRTEIAKAEAALARARTRLAEA